MANLNTPSKHAFYTEGDSLTEQEHADSCDINIMLKSAARGLQVRGSGEPQYGYDDTTMDAVQFRIQKARLEEELAETAKANEFLEKELDLIPKSIREKFGFKKKTVPESPASKNDDKTTQKTAGSGPDSQKSEKTLEAPSSLRKPSDSAAGDER